MMNKEKKENKYLSIDEVLESDFDMVSEEENRENLGWLFITDSWALLVK